MATALVLGLFAGFSIASESVPPAPAPGASPRTLQDPTESAIPGDGVYRVGDTDKGFDVAPGLYRARDNRECIWRVTRDATFETRSIIASDTSTGDAYVELRTGEFFDTNGCTTWRRVPGPGAPR